MIYLSSAMLGAELARQFLEARQQAPIDAGLGPDLRTPTLPYLDGINRIGVKLRKLIVEVVEFDQRL